ncbi:hypothetical protein QEH59_13690 [Coraliomargarita sp. SDUM461004]|uniref:Uncharacterized protein n=1 Tax=Thalassobacterium sedimentorum TaxID=3041258 RepID=A0ABU1AKZ6_9BACT|nr:hypothetical protein [Coraliomargarita sp. SDUM461004]MDQ8195482.1 hypothetical protein [Coraliomargarita sp. SDUM461004]
MLQIFIQTLRWLLTWFYFVLIICFIGAVLGVLTHVFFGLCFMTEPDYSFLAAFGFTNGLKYGGVWAGGFAIVLCVIRARKEYLQTHGESGE